MVTAKDGPIGEYNAGVEEEIENGGGIEGAEAETRSLTGNIAEAENADIDLGEAVAGEDSLLGAP
jgi:hypothetical protein